MLPHVRIVSLSLLTLVSHAQGQAFGLDSDAPITPYLNGRLPSTQAAASAAPSRLSEVGAFGNLATLQPVAGLIPYAVNSPLWSDGAAKRRWMAVPGDGNRDSPSERVAFSPTEPWRFPVGSVFLKHFEIALDETSPSSAVRRLETRFLVHGADGYYGLTYRWRPDGADADLLPEAGGHDSLSVRTAAGMQARTWKYPSRSDCMFCHNASAGQVLGLRAHQLNGSFTYPATGRADNQLRALNHLKLFTPELADDTIGQLLRSVRVEDASAPLADRARSYLDANCAHCHRPATTNAGFDLRFTTPPAQQNLIDGALLYPNGIANARVIAPGRPEASMALIRLASHGDDLMPPLGRSVVDAQAVEAIRQWILSLPPETVESAPPVARDDAILVAHNSPAAFEPLANDVGDPGSALRLAVRSSPAQGRLALEGNRVTYTPNAGFFGVDSFRYVAIDAAERVSNEATVTLHVSAASNASSIGFADRTSLLANRDVLSGVAMGVADMNGDGRDDVVRLRMTNELVMDFQRADGTFEGRSFGDVGLERWSMAAADVNHDGLNDLFIGGYHGAQRLHHASAGPAYTAEDLAVGTIFAQASNFADIDRDGWLDLFVCNDLGENAKLRNNRGALTSAPELIDTRTRTPSDNSGNYGSVWTDYDGDGDLDLYLAKCRETVSDPRDPRRVNMLLRNDGANRFEEVAASAGLALGDQSWAADFGDIDNDGDLDCFVANHLTASRLFRNEGNGAFTDVTLTANINVAFTVMQCQFRDFNNDGWLDLLLSGSHHVLYRSRRNGTFTPIADPFPGATVESFAVGDLNGDGFLDLVASHARLYNKPGATPDKLLLNNGSTNGYLAIQLVGRESNRNGVGARLTLEGPWGKQTREVRAGESYGVFNSFTQRFGLGAATLAPKLTVRWPSGVVDTALDLPANRTVVLAEGATAPPVLANPGSRVALVGRAVDVTLSASDPTGDRLTYSAVNLPPGLALDSATGRITGASTQPGAYQVVAKAADDFSSSQSGFLWEVLPSESAWRFWQETTPGAGGSPASDLDGDGWSDLLEFAFGTSPNSGWQGDLTPRLEKEADATLTARFSRPTGFGGVAHAWEKSADLQSWESVSASLTTTPNGAGSEIARLPRVRQLFPSTTTRGYLRVRVSLTDPLATAWSPPLAWMETPLIKGFQSHGLSVLRPAVFASRVSSNSADVIRPATNESLSLPDGHYLEITDGAHVGHRWDLQAGGELRLAAGSSRSTRASFPPDLAGASFVVRPHWTLASAYPAREFLASETMSLADQIHDLEDAGFTPRWLRPDGHWALATGTIADGQIIPPGRGCFLALARESAIFMAAGEIRRHDFWEGVMTNPRLLASPFAVPLTLAQRGLRLPPARDPTRGPQVFLWSGDTTPGAQGFLTCLTPAEGVWTDLNGETSLPSVAPDRALGLSHGQTNPLTWIVAAGP